jgi:hypothetical protein
MPEITANASVMPILASMKPSPLLCRPPWPFSSRLKYYSLRGNKIISRQFFLTANYVRGMIIAPAAGGILREVRLPDSIDPDDVSGEGNGVRSLVT